VPERVTPDASLKEIVQRILATGNPQKIILFGSRAAMHDPTVTTIYC
jgi:hypothetical protein